VDTVHLSSKNLIRKMAKWCFHFRIEILSNNFSVIQIVTTKLKKKMVFFWGVVGVWWLNHPHLLRPALLGGF